MYRLAMMLCDKMSTTSKNTDKIWNSWKGCKGKQVFLGKKVYTIEGL